MFRVIKIVFLFVIRQEIRRTQGLGKTVQKEKISPVLIKNQDQEEERG